MQEPVGLVNIASAALITQFSLIVIVVVGAGILWLGEPRTSRYSERGGPKVSNFAWIILAMALLTLGPLLLSQDYAATWRPVFGDLELPTLVSSKAFLLMFLSNIVALEFLVYFTGGSRGSAFSPIFFILPALAIFLREPIGRVAVYTSLIVLIFGLHLVFYRPLFGVGRDPLPEVRADTIALWVVSVASLVLTTAIGYVTRPG